MNTREINAIVTRAYDALDVLNNITWTSYRDTCHRMACAEERQHRSGRPAVLGRLPKGTSVEATARLFVVMRIAKALTDARKLELKDFLHIQESAFYAASLVANYRDEITKAWKEFDWHQLASLDYVEFINNGERP